MNNMSTVYLFPTLRVRGWLTFDSGQWTQQNPSTWDYRVRLRTSITLRRSSAQPHLFLYARVKLTRSRWIMFAGYLRLV
jgi:hypothetical protein